MINPPCGACGAATYGFGDVLAGQIPTVLGQFGQLKTHTACVSCGWTTAAKGGIGWRSVPFCPGHPGAATDIVASDWHYPNVTITTTAYHCAVCRKRCSHRNERLT